MSDDNQDSPFNKVVNTFNDGFNEYVKSVTLGTVKYENGQFQGGDPKKDNAVIRGADELVGEVTGRNANRAQIAENRGKLEEEKLAKQQEMASELELKKQKDIEASNTASALRKTAQQKQQVLGNDPTTDFLGL